jgi:hypothetical protein
MRKRSAAKDDNPVGFSSGQTQGQPAKTAREGPLGHQGSPTPDRFPLGSLYIFIPKALNLTVY